MDRSPSGRVFSVLTAAGVILLLLNLFEPVRIFKNAYLRILFPISRVLEYPAEEAGAVYGRARVILDLAGEAEALRAEAAALRLELGDHDYIKRKYSELSRDAGSVSQLPENPIAARVMIRPTEHYFTQFTVSRGSRDGVKKDSAVAVLREGRWVLAGRVDEVFEDFSRVLLITSSEFRCASVLENGALGVVRGSNSWDLTMDYVSPDAALSEGELVFTTGTGGIFPEGLLVGSVTSYESLEFSTGQQARLQAAFYPQNAYQVYIFR